ncbi:MAG: HupE/UreJ family protein [Sulfurifustis sp.]
MNPFEIIRSARKHSMRRAVAMLLVAVVALLAAASAGAHEIRPALVTATFDAAGRYEIELSLNLEALLAGVSPEHKDTNESPNAQRYNDLRALPPERLRGQVDAFLPRLLEGMRIEFDGQRVTPKVSAIEIPPAGDLGVSRLSRLRLSGEAPAGATTFAWAYAREFGASVLRVKRAEDTQLTGSWLKPGQASDAIPLHGPIAQKSRLEIAWQYLTLGYTHILPKGLDHILFVLGLFLLSTRWKPLLVQVTSFTVAHSITLGLSMYGIFSLSPSIVEPLIAASIVYVAVENVFTSDLHAWRPFVVFGFGLLHGMGFAGVLKEVGLPRSEFLTGLITFNVGVELGQLSVIALAFLVVGWWRKNAALYRGRVVVPASLAIAATGLYWTVERVIG